MTGAPTPATQWEGLPVTSWTARLGVPRLVICDVVSSTSDVIRELAARHAPAGTVCIAEQQTAGRGQHGRIWNDSHGRSLLLSMLFRPAPPRTGDAAPGALPLRIGIAAAAAVEHAVGVGARIKWPNDLVVPGQGKLGGILCEGVNAGADGGHVIVGVGINVGQESADFAPDLRDDATSVRLAGGTPDRAALCTDLVYRLLAFATQPLGPLDAAEMRALQSRDVLRGRDVVLADGSRTRTGTADGVEPDGALRIRAGHDMYLVRTGSVRLANPVTRLVP